MIHLYNHTYMPLLFLWVLLLLGSSSLHAQSPSNTTQDQITQDQMRALGFERVDLSALRQAQNSAPCNNCPTPRANRAAAPPSPAQELADLRRQLPTLQQHATASQADPNVAPAMRQKHQLALSRTQACIRTLEQQLASNTHSSEQ